MTITNISVRTAKPRPRRGQRRRKFSLAEKRGPKNLNIIMTFTKHAKKPTEGRSGKKLGVHQKIFSTLSLKKKLSPGKYPSYPQKTKTGIISTSSKRSH